jgi:hypothetical protein
MSLDSRGREDLLSPSCRAHGLLSDLRRRLMNNFYGSSPLGDEGLLQGLLCGGEIGRVSVMCRPTG